ncbi:MAG: DUF2306 domain-containing protein [Flavobacteriales bacterium]|nr:DUF2306 domain-containing protein [Flavobacteriales bacterium]
MLAISIGIYPLLYLLVDETFGLLNTKADSLLEDPLWKSLFYLHINSGGIALLSGWSQFHTKLRQKNLNLHKVLGKIYVISVLLSGSAGLYLGFHATGGLISSTGFISLGLIWLTSTYLAYSSVRNKDIRRHQYWMYFSYAACFAAVTLRIWLPFLTWLTADFITAYRIVSWLCWVPNIIFAFIITRSLDKSVQGAQEDVDQDRNLSVNR